MICEKVLHDLRSPLMAIKCYVALLQEEEKLTKDGEYHLDRILSATERMEELLGSLTETGVIQ